jgi:hydroxymethylpyrimidine/phosphomethylpyrimidine kinase
MDISSNIKEVAAVLTIAGSDSGGGAGIQADLKVFNALGCFGTTAISCITAQNPDEVRGVEAVSPAMVVLQVRAVCDSFPIAAVKTGMLFSAEIIIATAEVIKSCGLRNIVVDPVMVSTSEKRLLQEDAVEALQQALLPLADVITPNLPEAEVLCGHAIESVSDLKSAAQELSDKFGTACALKGGHLGECGTMNAERRKDSGDVADVLCCNGVVDVFRVARVDIGETHGTGCTFAAVVAAELAKGASVRKAVRNAQRYVAGALATAVRAGRHTPLGVPELSEKNNA